MVTSQCHKKDEIKPDWQAIRLDMTQHYKIEKEDQPYIKRIWDVFMYDKSIHTYCCEMFPSYYLIHIYTYVEFNEENRPPSGVDDRIEQTYCYCPTEDGYWHVSDIDKLSCSDKTNYTEPFEDEEDAREYMHSNMPF